MQRQYLLSVLIIGEPPEEREQREGRRVYIENWNKPGRRIGNMAGSVRENPRTRYREHCEL